MVSSWIFRNLHRNLHHIDIIISQLKPVIDEFVSKIELERQIQDLFEGKPDGPKKVLLSRIVNCPETDVLKRIGKLKDLSKILFNHPKFDQKGGVYYDTRGSYLDERFFHRNVDPNNPTQNPEFPRIYRVFPILVRASHLTIGDFKEINLEVSLKEVKVIKKHISDTVYQFLKDYGYIKRQGMRRYNNPILIRQLFDTVESVYLAAAIYENDNFITIDKASRALRMSHQLTTHLVEGLNMNPTKTFNVLSDTLNDFIVDALVASSGDFLAAYDEIVYYTDALNALDDLRTVTSLSRRAYRDSIRAALGSPWSQYSQLFHNPYYKAWNIITQLQDLFGTDPLSFDSLEDWIFDKATSNFIPHHMDPTKKMSNALYDQILTTRNYNPTYDTMPIAQQLILKVGIRQLIQLGIDGKGSAANGYINDADIKRVFAGKMFTVNSKGVLNAPILTQGSNLGLWDHYFSQSPRVWKMKLDKFNAKIKAFRTAFKSTGSQKQAYLAVLQKFYGKYAMTRFYSKAEEFAKRMMIISISGAPYRQRYPISSLGNYMYIYLTKLIFNL